MMMTSALAIYYLSHQKKVHLEKNKNINIYFWRVTQVRKSAASSKIIHDVKQNLDRRDGEGYGYNEGGARDNSSFNIANHFHKMGLL